MSVRIIQGDCRAVLRTLEAESVDCVVTSPPYWGLRDYGVAGAIGLEPSLGEHLSALVSVFREARRVLKKTGTCWVNYGDAYACAPNGRSAAETKLIGEDDRTFRDKPISTVGGTLKPKDRMLLPARFAIAMCDDGWWLRDEIIWHKPNPMPSSVKDRTTPAHEMIYMFSKSPRYFYDQEAVKEASVVTDRPSKKRGEFNGKTEAMPGRNAFRAVTETRNKRSVWTVVPKPFREAHFATFPPDLITPCILAGTPEQVCLVCGAPWVRVVEKTFVPQQDVSPEKGIRGAGDQKPLDASDVRQGFPRGSTHSETLGFKPTCKCDAATKPGTVLDPFGGAGTTGLVAQQHGRRAVLIELNPDYVAMAKRRLDADAGMSAATETEAA